MFIIKGLAASSGKINGKAVVVISKKDLEQVRKGDIIVARFTDPSFALALMKAGAIVTEVGGITAHAAIIARELGIPCVSGAAGIMAAVKSGTIIEVNGDTGEVTIAD